MLLRGVFQLFRKHCLLLGGWLTSLGAVLADEVEDEVEVLFGGVDLVFGKGFVDLDGVPKTFGLDAAYFREV